MYICFVTGHKQLLVVICNIHYKNSLKVHIMSSCAVLGLVQIHTDESSYIFSHGTEYTRPVLWSTVNGWSHVRLDQSWFKNHQLIYTT
jgi:hypothetical protein